MVLGQKIIQYGHERKCAFIFAAIGFLITGFKIYGIIFGYASGLCLDYLLRNNENNSKISNELSYLPFWKRAIAFIIDGGFVYFLYLVLRSILSTYYTVTTETTFGFETVEFISQYKYWLRGITALVFFMIISSKWRTSIGGKLLKAVIKKNDNTRITFLRSFWRVLVSWMLLEIIIIHPYLIEKIPSLALLVVLAIFLPIILSKGTVSIVDIISGSYFVNSKRGA